METYDELKHGEVDNESPSIGRAQRRQKLLGLWVSDAWFRIEPSVQDLGWNLGLPREVGRVVLV